MPSVPTRTGYVRVVSRGAANHDRLTMLFTRPLRQQLLEHRSARQVVGLAVAVEHGDLMGGQLEGDLHHWAGSRHGRGHTSGGLGFGLGDGGGAWGVDSLGMQCAKRLPQRVARVVGFPARQVADSCLSTVAGCGNLRLAQAMSTQFGDE